MSEPEERPDLKEDTGPIGLRDGVREDFAIQQAPLPRRTTQTVLRRIARSAAIDHFST